MSASQSLSPRIRLAGVLVDEGRLLVVEHARNGKKYCLLPGGGLEWGESMEQGLAREFREELNLQVQMKHLLAINESISPDAARHIINFTFLVERTGGVMRVAQDDRLKNAFWLFPEELKKVTFYPDIRDFLFTAWKDNFAHGIAPLNTPWNMERQAS
jgi:ADP-ribose pyrophosphatase YjhB (NUDIX family)